MRICENNKLVMNIYTNYNTNILLYLLIIYFFQLINQMYDIMII